MKHHDSPYVNKRKKCIEFHIKNACANKISLAGDFNNWDPAAFPMKHEGDEWSFKVHLSAGKHRYKFIADGKWMLDPYNKLWEQNEYGTGNSIIWVDN